MERLDYDVVICTRNRLDALELSIPSIVHQSRKPKSIIVVDSSDDHTKVVSLIRKISSDLDFEIRLFRSDIASSSAQRNIGLNYVTSPIVFFPDDDSIFFPAASEEIMKVYELDDESEVVGVCAVEAEAPPEGILEKPTYKLNFTDNIKKSIAVTRYKIESLFFEDPAKVLAHRLIDKKHTPDWMNQDDHTFVEYMTGFRMTFRTDAIISSKFCESFTGYCIGEDLEASLSVLNKGVLIGAKKARIYHHKYPSKRASGFSYGARQILNNAYIISKHSKDTIIRKLFLIRSKYKLFQYMLGATSEFGRSRFKGGLYGYKNIKYLYAASNDNLDSVYKNITRNL